MKKNLLELGDRVRIHLPGLLLAFQAAFMLIYIKKKPYVRSSEMTVTQNAAKGTTLRIRGLIQSSLGSN